MSEHEEDISGLLDYVGGVGSFEFDMVLDEPPIAYECHVCRKDLEDMLCCHFCLGNVCPKCAIMPSSDEAYCSVYCLSNSLDETLYTCCVCKNEDVFGTDIMVCLTCENQTCLDCAVLENKAYFCSRKCISNK